MSLYTFTQRTSRWFRLWCILAGVMLAFGVATIRFQLLPVANWVTPYHMTFFISLGWMLFAVFLEIEVRWPRYLVKRAWKQVGPSDASDFAEKLGIVVDASGLVTIGINPDKFDPFILGNILIRLGNQFIYTAGFDYRVWANATAVKLFEETTALNSLSQKYYLEQVRRGVSDYGGCQLVDKLTESIDASWRIDKYRREREKKEAAGLLGCQSGVCSQSQRN